VCTQQVINLGVIFHPGSYCRDLWNILDATVVICALVAFFFTSVDTSFRSEPSCTPVLVLLAVAVVVVIIISSSSSSSQPVWELPGEMFGVGFDAPSLCSQPPILSSSGPPSFFSSIPTLQPPVQYTVRGVRNAVNSGFQRVSSF